MEIVSEPAYADKVFDRLYVLVAPAFEVGELDPLLKFMKEVVDAQPLGYLKTYASIEDDKFTGFAKEIMDNAIGKFGASKESYVKEAGGNKAGINGPVAKYRNWIQRRKDRANKAKDPLLQAKAVRVRHNLDMRDGRFFLLYAYPEANNNAFWKVCPANIIPEGVRQAHAIPENSAVAFLYQLLHLPSREWSMLAESPLLVQTHVSPDDQLLLNFREHVRPANAYGRSSMKLFNLAFGGLGSPLIYFAPEYKGDDVRFTMEALDERRCTVAGISDVFKTVSGAVGQLPLPVEAMPFLAMGTTVASLAIKVAEFLISDVSLFSFPIHFASREGSNRLCTGLYIAVDWQEEEDIHSFCEKYELDIAEKKLQTKVQDPTTKKKEEVPTTYCIFEVTTQHVEQYANWKAHIQAAELVTKGDWKGITDLVVKVAQQAAELQKQTNKEK